MIRVFDAFSGIGGFRSAFEEWSVSKRWAGARLTDSHRNPTVRFLTREVNSFMRISEILTQQEMPSR